MATYLYRKNTAQPNGFHSPNNFQYCQPYAHFYARDSPEPFPEFCMTESPNEQLLTSPSPRPLQPPFYSVSVCLANLPKIRGIMQCLSFGDWLISLSIISSRFIHVVGYDRVFFFSCIVFIYHNFQLFICQWTFRVLPSLGYCEQLSSCNFKFSWKL